MNLEEAHNRLPRFITDPEWANTFWDRPYVVFDLETTNKDKGSHLNSENELVSVIWFVVSEGEVQKRCILYARDWHVALPALWDDILNTGIVVSHNVKFEAGWLMRFGFPVHEVFWYDTMLGEKAILSNRQGQLTLEASCNRHVSSGNFKDTAVSNLIKGGICPSTIERGRLLRYNLLDVHAHMQLYEAHRVLLRREGLHRVAMVKSILAIVLLYIEAEGLLLDSKLVLDLAISTATKLELATRELSSIHPLNAKSSKQKREVLFERFKFAYPINPSTGKPFLTETGEVSTGVDALSHLVAKTEEQREYLELIKRVTVLTDLRSKYLDKLEEAVRNGERLHFSFNQTVARTSRLSSKGAKYSIQGQNIPRDIKNLFMAPTGYILGECDHSTIEYTVAGFLGSDVAALHDLRHNVDAHGLTASIVFQDKWDDSISSKAGENAPLRQSAKAHTFKPLYGGQQGSEKEVAYYKWFKDKHKGISAEQERWAESAVIRGYVQSLTGLKFYFPDARRTKYGVKGFTKISNYAIQYLATGEISPIAVVLQFHMMKALKMQSVIVNTIHDQSLTHVKHEEEEQYKELANYCFVDGVKRQLYTFYGIDFNYPIEAEIQTGTHWKMG